MSYARFGWDNSDVYVYYDTGGYYNCCACALRPSTRPENLLGVESFHCQTKAEMIAHLIDEHRAAGHTVPDDCIEELRAETNYP